MEKNRSRIKLDRRAFITKRENIHSIYDIAAKALGKGSFADVHLCVNKVTKEARAVKIIYKHKMTSVDSFLQEIEALKQLVHHLTINHRTIQTSFVSLNGTKMQPECISSWSIVRGVSYSRRSYQSATLQREMQQ